MGRRLFSSAAAERLLRHHSATSVATSASDLPDLDEEDVWATAAATSGARSSWRLVDCVDHRRHVGGLSRVLDGGAVVAMSAPVEVTFPEWAKKGLGRIGSVEPVGGSTWEEEVDEEGDWVPPHEYLARQQGKTALATSVFEGVGRTLKGRDMSRVRNAVWSQTGFFG
ncbi:uncharacterized protein LOC110115400 [Dendrobium catenatum]|uniref:Uncharacterized protein n=1 Tax=Dendrobium catenatum TaxID=906689 RepID=A0A2I0WR44_9ASPA|nr:uncharacterized protein LOC110115400 [Dendrobium catenatum]PKU78130.1 hypothetical protein MA16_Dca027544 [Dendrobium catenatum]